MAVEQWEVLENAGQSNEVMIDDFESYKQAKAYVSKAYTKAEIDELGVDITKNGSTEY